MTDIKKFVSNSFKVMIILSMAAMLGCGKKDNADIDSEGGNTGTNTVDSESGEEVTEIEIVDSIVIDSNGNENEGSSSGQGSGNTSSGSQEGNPSGQGSESINEGSEESGSSENGNSDENGEQTDAELGEDLEGTGGF